MYIAAPDDIYNVIVPQDGGNINDYGMGPLPSTSGTPAGSLSGGDDYMFNKRDTPAQIRAGIKWLDFEDLTPGQGQFDYAGTRPTGCRSASPSRSCSPAPPAAKNQQLQNASATINTAYYSTFSRRAREGHGRAGRRPGGLQDAGPGHARAC